MVDLMKRSRGTTLPELMIAVAILGVVVTMGPLLITNFTKFTRLNTARLDTQQGARITLAQVNQNLRQASASSVIISQETNQPPCSSLSFTTVDGRFLKYYQENQELKFVSNISTTTLAENLQYVAFTPPRTDDSKIVSVSVTFEKDTYQGGKKALQMAIEKVRIMND